MHFSYTKVAMACFRLLTAHLPTVARFVAELLQQLHLLVSAWVAPDVDACDSCCTAADCCLDNTSQVAG